MGAGAVARAAPDPGGSGRREQELALPADIEQAGLEADPDGEPAEDERCRLEDRVQDSGLRTDRALEQGAVGHERQGPIDRAGRDEARDQDDHGGDDQGQEDRRDGHRRDGEDLTEASAPPEGFGWLDAGDGHVSAPARRPDARRPVAMSRPTSSLLAPRPSKRRHELAAIHDGDPVGQLEDLVELGRDEQDRRAGVAHLDGPAVDELDAPDVQAARRLVEDQHLRARS